MNVNLIANNCVTSICENQLCYFYQISGIDNTGELPVPIFENPIEIFCNIQLANNQKYTNIDGWQSTNIYRRFFINSLISGFDFQANIGQSYIVYDNIKHFIIEIENDFRTGFTVLIGCQSND